MMLNDQMATMSNSDANQMSLDTSAHAHFASIDSNFKRQIDRLR